MRCSGQSFGEYQTQEEEKEQQNRDLGDQAGEKSGQVVRSQGKGVLEQQAMLSFWRRRTRNRMVHESCEGKEGA